MKNSKNLNMFNIAFTYPTPFNPIYGGVERVTDILCKAFIQRGHKVFYFHTRLPERYSKFQSPAPYTFSANPDYSDKQTIDSYHNFILSNNIDIIINQCGNFSDSKLYTNTPFAGKRTKILSVLHSDPLLNYNHLASEILKLKNNSLSDIPKLIARLILYSSIKKKYLRDRKRSLRFTYNNSDKTILLSSGYINCLSQFLENTNRIHVIPNPCPYEQNNLYLKKKHILFVGRLDFGQKRPDRVIQIWKRICFKYPDWELYVIGDGSQKERLMHKARRLPRIHFEGYQNPELYYRSASILLNTSNFEGFPMVLPEAMAYGVIPFSFDSYAAVKDIINDNLNGFIIDSYCINDYTNKLCALISNEKKIIEMRANCLKKSKTFSLNPIIDKWESIFYERLMPS